MRGSFLRSLLSSVVAASFAFSAMAWGTMPECRVQGMPGHGGTHDRPAQHHSPHHPAPASQSCAAHLCCAHVSPQTSVALALGHSATVATDARLAAAAEAPRRPAHTLPFAQAPPQRLG